MRSLARVLLTATVLSAGFALSACDSFDGLLDYIDAKKKLPGQRKPVFPEGVPGVTQGVPPELKKGYHEPVDQTAMPPDQQPPAEAAASPPPPARPARASATAPAAGQPVSLGPGGQDETEPNPKPKVAAKPKAAKPRAAPPAEAAQAPPPAAPAQEPQAMQSRWPTAQQETQQGTPQPQRAWPQAQPQSAWPGSSQAQ